MTYPSSEKSETLLGWLIDPINDCLTYLVEEINTCGLIVRSIQNTELLSTILPLALERSDQISEKLTQALTTLLQLSKNDSQFARDEIKRDFSIVRMHSAIGLWSAIETMVENVLASHINKHPELRDKIKEKYPDIKIKNKPNEPLENSTLRLIKNLENLCDGETVGKRYEEMLSAVGLEFSISDEIATGLNDLNEFRNLALHRRSIVDARFLAKSSFKTHKVGEKFTISDDEYIRFYDSCCKFTTSAIGSIRNSPYAGLKTQQKT